MHIEDHRIDPEVNAIAHVCAALAKLPGTAARVRVLRWAMQRFAAAPPSTDITPSCDVSDSYTEDELSAWAKATLGADLAAEDKGRLPPPQG
jgi:hypothetical protein